MIKLENLIESTLKKLRVSVLGAALAVSLKLAAQIAGGVIVTIFPDGGARYSSEHFWNEHD